MNFLIDEEDRELIERYSWSLNGSEYLLAWVNGKMVSMHRLLLNAPKGIQVDHVNGDKLDNRRSNLRLCTNAENLRNQRISKNNSSGYKGVSWYKRDGKWQANITLNGVQKHLGRFTSKEDAALAYNEAAIKLFGEFALLNQIGG